jgi:hypothetical protein
MAGVDVNRYPNAIQYIERNVQHVLIDQIYQSDSLPGNYQDYKRRIVVMDEMRRQREIYKGTTRSPVYQPKDANAMEVD